MESRPVSFDFYHVQMRTERGHSFDRALSVASSLPDDSTRNYMLTNGHPIRLQTATRQRPRWLGEIMQIKMSDIPMKASLNGKTGSLELEDHEGIGMGVVFLYDISTNIIVIQRNKFSVSASNLAHYMTDKGNSGLIYFQPVLNKSAFQRLAGLREPRNLKIKVSGLQRAEVFKSQGHGVSDIADLMELTKAPTLELTASFGHRKGSLSRKGILELIHGLLKLGRKDEIVQQLIVSGKDEDDHADIINLLKEGLTSEEKVAIDGRRTLSYQARQSAIIRA